MTVEVKACPFCGGEKVSASKPLLSRLWAVYCEDCEIAGPKTTDESTAIEVWNTRAIEAALAEGGGRQPGDVDAVIERTCRHFGYTGTKPAGNVLGFARRAVENAFESLSNPPPVGEVERLRKALTEARGAIATLGEFDLGGVDIPDTHTGEIVGQYGIRDELLSNIDAALKGGFDGE